MIPLWIFRIIKLEIAENRMQWCSTPSTRVENQIFKRCKSHKPSRQNTDSESRQARPKRAIRNLKIKTKINFGLPASVSSRQLRNRLLCNSRCMQAPSLIPIGTILKQSTKMKARWHHFDSLKSLTRGSNKTAQLQSEISLSVSCNMVQSRTRKPPKRRSMFLIRWM